MLETKAAFARRLGLHRSTVTRAAEAGRLVLNAEGQVEVEQSLARWQATKGARDDVSARHAEIRGAAIPKPQPAPENATTADLNATAAKAPPADPPQANGGRARFQTMALHFQNQRIKRVMSLRRCLR